MAITIPRFLLPRFSTLLRTSVRLYPRSSALQPHYSSSTCRYASNSSTSEKPRVLEKPARFNPPSHPARLNRAAPRQFPGPPLSKPEQEAQKTRQYPAMFPPEGSFMRWFLTNRSIHIWISLSTLFSLAVITLVLEFHRTSPFAHLLPPANHFLTHPINHIAQYIEVYKMHTARISAETAERRKKRVDDVQKRAAYRRAHGLEGETGLGGWTAKGDDEVAASPSAASTITGAGNSESTLRDNEATAVGMAAAEGVVGIGDVEENSFVDFDGKRRKVKKWFGIW